MVQFEPREGEAGGKPVRNVRIREVGFKDQSVPVSLTIWPEHAHVEISEGDVLFAEGTYRPNTQTRDDGSKVTYHNLSVSRLLNLGAADSGRSEDDEPAEAADDDDIPF